MLTGPGLLPGDRLLQIDRSFSCFLAHTFLCTPDTPTSNTNFFESRDREIQRQKDIEIHSDREFSSPKSFPECLQGKGLVQTEAGSHELNSGFPSEWQKPNYLSDHCYHPGPGMARNRNRDGEQRVSAKPNARLPTSDVLEAQKWKLKFHAAQESRTCVKCLNWKEVSLRVFSL